MACYRFIQSNCTLIVDFDGDTCGTAVVDEIIPSRVGKHYSYFWVSRHDTKSWEPCEDPRQSQRVNKMLKHIKDV